MKKIACWIWLSCRFRNGQTVNRLLEEFGSPEAVYRASGKTPGSVWAEASHIYAACGAATVYEITELQLEGAKL